MFPDYQQFLDGEECIAIVGLGYIGLPLAVLLSRKYRVLGFDINPLRILELQGNFDRTGELSSRELAEANITFVSGLQELSRARLIIVAVPTPVDIHHKPDLNPLFAAVRQVGRHLSPGTTVVFESTVYPGLTEDVCKPMLASESGLQSQIDFKLAYSPERVNPGDREHRLITTAKIVSAEDPATLTFISLIYGSVIEAQLIPVMGIRIAEAAKVIENIQRDLNIALVNELALIFQELKIDLREVLKAASSKWNFTAYEPGLVGGHCIGVDPYYLTYKCEEIAYYPEVILAGRRVNNMMGKYIAEQLVKHMSKTRALKDARVLIMGFTYKENVRDVRNSRVVDIYRELCEYSLRVFVYDPLAWKDEVKEEYGISLLEEIASAAPYDAVISAVRHRELTDISLIKLRSLCGDNPLLADVKAFYTRSEAEDNGFLYWGLW